MEQEDIAVAIAELKKEIGSLKHRMTDAEKVIESINHLAISIEKLAISVSTITERQDTYEERLKTQGERIGELEKADAEKWKYTMKTILATVVTGIVCFAMAKLGL